jgi:hypothetical protein
MIERLRKLGGRHPEETRELVVGTALVATVVSDFHAFVDPSPTSRWVGLILTGALLPAAAAFAVYAFSARKAVPYLAPVAYPRFGRRTRAFSVGALLVTAAVAAVLLRGILSYPGPDIPVYIFNNTGQTIRISAGAVFDLEDAPSAAPKGTEPSRGVLLLRARRGGRGGTPDISVAPHTAITVFGEVVDPERYRRALESSASRITITAELKFPVAGLRLSSPTCSVPGNPSAPIPCTLRLG